MLIVGSFLDAGGNCILFSVYLMLISFSSATILRIECAVVISMNGTHLDAQIDAQPLGKTPSVRQCRIARSVHRSIVADQPRRRLGIDRFESFMHHRSASVWNGRMKGKLPF